MRIERNLTHVLPFRKFLRVMFIFMLFIGPGQRLWAQQDSTDDLMSQSVGDLTVVATAGAFGAVLGLSTLSFYDSPSEHYRNILIGGALGIIIGVGVVAYSQATKSKEGWTAQLSSPQPGPIALTTNERKIWHYENFNRFLQYTPKPNMLVPVYLTTF